MQNIIIDEISLENAILYKVKVKGVDVEALYDTGASISVMSKCFLSTFQSKAKLIKCNRNISGMGGEALIPLAECFLQLQIGKGTFHDRVIVIDNLMHNYILGQVLQRTNRLSISYWTAGRHYITINQEMLAQSISHTMVNPILKVEGKVR